MVKQRIILPIDHPYWNRMVNSKFKVRESFDQDNYQNSFVNVLATFKSRKDWKAVPPSRIDKPLKTPVPYLVFSSVQVTGEDIKLTSAEVVKALQERDMQLGMSDIQCNFVVTEDGNVWEGRGWLVRPGSDDDYPSYEGRFVEITNVGNFSSAKVKRATTHLVDIGVLYEFLHRDVQQLGPEKRRKGLSLEPPPCPFENIKVTSQLPPERR